MTLNSIRRWCLISQKDARWEVFLTILCVWCTVCGGASSSTTVEQTLVVQTDSEVCIVKTRSPITTAMRPKQNKTCTPVTFTLTSPTTTKDSTSMGSSRTNEASTEYPTTTLIFPEPTTAPSATENTAPLFTTTTRPATETTFVTPTTMPMFSEITTFLTTTSLKNATQLSATNNPAPTELATQSSMSLATTDTSAPTLIIVTQETTMSLSMSTTSDSQTTDETPLIGTGTETIQTTAVITSTLLFNSSSPVPSEALVLNAISKLRESRESQLNGSVKVVNVTYQKTSETSYAVIFSFNLSNISMPENPKLINSTYVQLQDVVNNALNTLLNEPTSPTLKAKLISFETTSNQINGRMEYTFQDGDIIQPVSFLNELRTPTELTSTTVFPESTTSSSVTLPNLISGSAVITSTLLFDSSSPVPSEALVLNAISKLRESRESQLNGSVTVVNVTYQKISESSYAVVFSFNLSNISMPENPELRNSTYVQLQDVVNNALNTLLNEPTSPTLKAKSTSFESTSNQINGRMEYTFQDGDIIQPVSFLNELLTLTVLTTASTLTTIAAIPQTVSGRVYIFIQLVFKTLGPIPNEADVLEFVKPFTTQPLRTKLVSVQPSFFNVTFTRINDTAYALTFGFEVSNELISEKIELRNDTYIKIQTYINNLLTDFLDDTTAPQFHINEINFTNADTMIQANVAYIFSESDMNTNSTFVKKLFNIKGVSTTASTLTSTTIPLTLSGSAVITSTLLFNSSSPVPSEALVLNAISKLRKSRESQLNGSVTVVNVTYQKMSETSYAVIFSFNLSNISMPENLKLINSTYVQLQDVVNNALNTLLNEPTSPTLKANSTNFESTSNQINGSMDYIFQDGDIIQPVSFLNELRTPTELTSTTVFPESTTGSSVTLTNLISGSAVITSTLLFNSSSPVPSEALVLNAISKLRQSRESQLNGSVKLVNVTYQKTSETSYAVIFSFNLSNISMPENPELRNSTYVQLQDVVNNALNTLLNEPTSPTLKANSTNFESTSNQINGSMEYTFQDGDIIQPVSFLNELLTLTVLTTASTLTTIAAIPQTVSGRVYIFIQLVFKTLGPIPNEADVLEFVKPFTTQPLRTKLVSVQPSFLNVTFTSINYTTYALTFGFEVSNELFSEKIELRTETYIKIQTYINNLLTDILNDTTAPQFHINEINFTNADTMIQANVAYIFSESDMNTNSTFVKKLFNIKGVSTTASTLTSTTIPLTLSGSAVITSTLLFNSSSPVPSEALVLNAISKLRKSRESQLNGLVKVVNVTYLKISETSYAVIFSFNLSNISMPENPELRNSTYVQLQDVVNNALNTLLNEPTSPTLKANSTNFESTSNQINGSMEYTFQNGDILQPVSFLNELRTPTELTSTTVFPESTIGSSVTLPNLISGSAVITSTLLFKSSSPVPSEALVLNAINKLRLSRESQLNNSVKVVNVTYQKMSETSYAVIFSFNLSNISMPENPELRNSTYVQLQDVVNNALNTLLNEPTSPTLKANSTNFETTSNQINGRMEYTFQDGDIIQPVTELTSTTVFPESTTGPSVTLPNLISGSAVITSTLLFNSSSPVPSEALVLNAISKLRQSRESQLNGSVKVVNVTYQKMSETSYAVIFSFDLSNISMPENPELRNSTYMQLQDVVNNALNTLLNEPTSPTLKANSTSFETKSNQINGRMEYTFQNGDIIQPVSFLNELRTPTELTSTTVFPESTTGSSVTLPNLISGSAVITSTLLFNSSSPVPSEALVLNVINKLRLSRESQLNNSVKVVNVTYQKISETSYAVIFSFNLSNISMPENPELRNSTYVQLQDVINNVLNTLLNEPTSPILKANSTNFKSTSNQINGSMEYTFQDGDIIQPVSFLNELRTPTVSTTASTLTTITTIPPTLLGRVSIFIQLVFKTLGPIPSKDDVLKRVTGLPGPLLRTKVLLVRASDVSFVDVTFTNITDTAYALTFGFEISNVLMSEKIELRNDTYIKIQNYINNLLTDILDDTTAPQFHMNEINFTNADTVIQANVTYSFSERDLNTNSTFVKELFNIKGALTTTSTPTTSITAAPTVTGRVIIYIALVFKTKGRIPTESSVLEAATSLLVKMKLRTKRAISEKDVSAVNVTYTKIDSSSFSLNFGFEINNITMSETLHLRNDTLTVIENYINTFVSKVLNKTPATQFNFKDVNFRVNSTVIEANVEYIFTDDDIDKFGLVSLFLSPATTVYPTVLVPTVTNNSTNVAWIVAIIVPVSIVLILIPCWILLCCLLCGCCAAVRRRWHRRQSYNVQYTTRNSLF